jgi:hypothetical protein
MAIQAAANLAYSGSDVASAYVRHRPEQALPYRIVAQHYPAFRAQRAHRGSAAAELRATGVRAYLKCGRLEHLRARCERCHAEQLVAFSCGGAVAAPPQRIRRVADTRLMAGCRVSAFYLSPEIFS